MSFLVTLAKPLAYLSLPVFLCHTASNSSSIARYYIRLGLYLSSLGICSAWGVVVSIGMTIIGRRLDINWVIARSFYALAGSLLGIRFEVEGEENLTDEPTLLLGNHQSMLDILYLGRILPKRSSIIAKKELFWAPLLGQFLQLSGAIAVDRGDNQKAVTSLKVAGETIRSRRSALWVFPEGTRTNKPEVDLLPFKKGAFHVAIQAGASLTPVVCENYWRLYHKGVFESGNLKLKVLPPVPTAGLTAADIPQLMETVRNQMLVALHEISGSPLPLDTSSSQTTIKESQPEESPPLAQAPAIEEEAVPTELEVTEPIQKEASGDVSPEESVSTSSVLGSDRGAETEEDDGMVLVDRPNQ